MSNEKALALKERRQELSELSLSRQGGEMMVPKNGAELMDMASMVSRSDFMVRDFYRNNPGACAALIMLCAPYRMNPFQVSWKTYKASKNQDAPIAFEAQLVNAMVNVSAPVKGRLRYSYEGEGDKRTCTVIGIDRETGEEITYTSPPVGRIPTKNSPLWKADPDQQLGYYSARAWCRRHFPELLLGVYTQDELKTEGMRNVTPDDLPGGGLQARVKAAQDAAVQAMQEAPEEFEEAEVIPEGDVPPEDAYEAAFPGSDAYTEGAKAFAAGTEWGDCPYEDGTQEAADWLGGWIGARQANGGEA